MFEIIGIKNMWEFLVTTILGLWLGSMEYRMRKVRDEQANKPSRDEVEKTIELHQRELKVMLREAKESMNKIEHKIDKMSEYFNKN